MRIFLFFFLVVLYTQILLAQGVGINVNGTTPDPSAGLDVNFVNKGLLPPRLTTAQRNAISSPANGLIVFNTETNCMEYYRPSGWYSMCPLPPKINTSPVTSVTAVSAVAGGQVTDDGGSLVTARGVCWSTSPLPTLSSSVSTDGSGIGSFSSTLSALQYGTTYFLRAYATNAEGTTYGNQVTFTTITPNLPTVTTAVVSSITGFTATVGGEVTSDGGLAITSRGICWSLTANPTLSNNILNIGTGVGSFSSSLTGLNSGTTYNLRSFAVNDLGVSYGPNVIFTTLSSSPILGGGLSIAGATFQSSTTLATNVAQKAFDGTVVDYWHSSQYDKVPWANPWLRINLPAGRIVNRYRLWHRNMPSYEDRLMSWVFQGSNDGQNWVDLDVRNNATPPYPGTDIFSAAQFGDYSFSNATPYSYYRIWGTEGNPGHEYTVIGELQLWGF